MPRQYADTQLYSGSKIDITPTFLKLSRVCVVLIPFVRNAVPSAFLNSSLSFTSHLKCQLLREAFLNHVLKGAPSSFSIKSSIFIFKLVLFNT